MTDKIVGIANARAPWDEGLDEGPDELSHFINVGGLSAETGDLALNSVELLCKTQQCQTQQ